MGHNQKSSQLVLLICVLLIGLSFGSCYSRVAIEQDTDVFQNKKMVILHTPERELYLIDIRIDEDFLSGNIANQLLSYPKSEQIYMYTDSSIALPPADQRLLIPLKWIQKTEVYKTDKRKVICCTAGVGVGAIGLMAVALVGLIVYYIYYITNAF
jgi:hypothetical protein